MSAATAPAATRRTAPALACLSLLLPVPAALAQAADPWPGRADMRRAIEIEVQAVQSSRNDVQIPNDARGTRFGLDGLTGGGAFPGVRLEVVWPVNARDELRGLIAPLRASGDAVLGGPVDFQGARFAAGADTRADYRFDSYRLTWRRLVWSTDTGALRLGLTGKVRDALIRLEQPGGGPSAQKTDTGFVPLLHAAWEQRLGERWRFVADIDALGGGQGRAIDAGLKLRYAIAPDWSASLSWRVLDGGADNGNLYNMARFQFIGVGVQRRF